MVHTYTAKSGLKRALKRRTKRDEKKKNTGYTKIKLKLKERKHETKNNIRSGHRPSLEGTTLLLAVTIGRLICPGDIPTEGRQH